MLVHRGTVVALGGQMNPSADATAIQLPRNAQQCGVQ